MMVSTFAGVLAFCVVGAMAPSALAFGIVGPAAHAAYDETMQTASDTNDEIMASAEWDYYQTTVPYFSTLNQSIPRLAPVTCMALPANEWTVPNSRCFAGNETDQEIQGNLLPFVEYVPLAAMGLERESCDDSVHDAEWYGDLLFALLP